MEAYAAVLNYAIPFFIVLILIEWGISKYRGLTIGRSMDTISSLSSGFTNSIKDVLGLSITIISYKWMVGHLAIYNIESKLWMFIAAFIGLDFAGYWGHRFSHEINVLWNRHIVHHSSEEFNLACALRQSISQIFGIFFFLLLPMAFIGVPTEIIAVVAPIHLFAQFWYHTTLIDKMGVFEIFIVTPSHHRVHHSINPIYLDKNYGQIFIFWDKLFGTFQEELTEEPPVYGVKRAVKTWNPILINWQHFSMLVMDAIRTKNWGDKFKLWFMPTGWRPEDMKEKYPIEIIDNVSTQEKYETNASKSLKAWSWAQLIINMLLIFYLFNNIADIGLVDMMLYGLFLMTSIFSYTTLMDGSKYSILTELIKMGIGFSLLYWQQGWYGIDGFIGFGSIIVGAYLVLSMAATVYFEVGEWKELRSKGKVRIAG